MRMKIGEAKAHLSRLVAAAEAGEEVVLCRGAKAVARIVPVAAAGGKAAAPDGEKPWMALFGKYAHLAADMPDEAEWMAPVMSEAEYERWLNDPLTSDGERWRDDSDE